jgi:DNA topoisomerase-3
VTRYFLASCSDDAVGQTTTVEIDVADEIFSTSGLSIEALNFFEVR